MKSYDLRHIFSMICCKSVERVTQDEYANIRACFPESVRRYGLQGELYESGYRSSTSGSKKIQELSQEIGGDSASEEALI